MTIVQAKVVPSKKAPNATPITKTKVLMINWGNWVCHR